MYVDFAHTPDGLEKVLMAARGFTPSGGRLWIVFGAGGDRDPMKRPLMGEVCALLADRVVVTSDNPRSEDPMAIVTQILAGMGTGPTKAFVLAGSTGPVPTDAPTDARIFVEPDRGKAIAYALTNAEKGDVVIIAGKGHETTQEIKGVKHPFDDREAVRSFFMV